MTIFEMKEIVRKHTEAEEGLEALCRLINHLRSDGATNAVDTMLGHVMGTAVAPLVPQSTRNAIAEKLWQGIVALREAEEDEVKKLNSMK